MLVDKSTSIIIGRHVDQHINQISVSILPVWRWTLGQYGDLQMSAEYRSTVGGILINCHIIQWKCCWKIDLTSFLLFWEPSKKPIKCGLSEMNNLLKRTNLRKTAFRDLIRYWVLFSRMHVYIWTNGLTHGKIFEQSLVGGRFWRFLKGELVGHSTI